MIEVNLPSELAVFTAGNRYLQLNGYTLADALDRIQQLAPMLKTQVLDADGNVRRAISFVIDGRPVTRVDSRSMWATDVFQIDIAIAQ